MVIDYDWKRSSFNEVMFDLSQKSLKYGNCDEGTLFGAFEYKTQEGDAECKYQVDVMPSKDLKNYRLEVYKLAEEFSCEPEGCAKRVATLEPKDIPRDFTEFTQIAGNHIACFHGLLEDPSIQRVAKYL